MKIAGAAQRRNRQGLLIQGSVQPPPGLESADWPESICREASRQFGVQWRIQPLDPTLTQCAEALADAKYRQGEFSRRR
jgi:lipoate-protein ligase A